ncbi:DUF1289 domain-containing protein [Methylovulum miyakonense]|uniref:DUF1289 domain-containing protein n=1 Tax=Methylovulum miyakonense TaxID=645578 RepID=UPI00039BEFC5|nr:DUF1289 domain-containing protein [Methylovulum miyakonense]
MTALKPYTASPCIRICCLDDKDICLGCFRSLTEITQWALVDDHTRQHILHNASHRQRAYGPHRPRLDNPQ